MANQRRVRIIAPACTIFKRWRGAMTEKNRHQGRKGAGRAAVRQLLPSPA
jgi:hypothetical protein